MKWFINDFWGGGQHWFRGISDYITRNVKFDARLKVGSIYRDNTSMGVDGA